MYFKSTPTPGFKQLIKTGGISTQQDKDIIEGIQSAYNNLIPQSASIYITSYLEAIPELDLNNSDNITLRIEIDEDTNEVGTVLIVSQNLDSTITTIKVPNNNWPTSIASEIKLPSKWPTLGKCVNCLKFDFLEGSNDYNFYGSLGGEWTGQYINGQKEYRFFLPDYSNALNYGATTEYRVRWRPNASYTGNDYDGNPISFTNQKRWVATPVSQINSPLNTLSFFHVTPGDSASCPYYNDTPLTPPWYNFLGEKGYFLTSLANQLPDKPCPTFSPIPGEVSWGWNCNPNTGCVPSPSGSLGLYATLEECNVSCSIIDPDPVTSWRCLDGNCIEIQGPSGQYATEAECIEECKLTPPEPPIIYECVEGNCYPITSGSVATGSFFNTLLDCQTSCSVPPVPTYEYLCTPNGCAQFPSGSLTGSFFTSIEECEATCNIPVITECNCTGDIVNISNSNFSQGSTSWTYSPNPSTPGVGGWSFASNQAKATVQEEFNSLNVSNIYLSQLNVLTISCSYEVCFQAWSGTPGATSSLVSVDTGDYTTNLPVVTTPLTTTPTAYSFVISNIQTTDLTFFLSSPEDKIYIDNICVKQTYCPPPTELTGSELCIITGSSYCYEDVTYDCTCPEGYTSNGSGSCIQSGSLIVNANAGFTSSINPSLNNAIIFGYSINQPPPPAPWQQLISIASTQTAGTLPAYIGSIQPILYYDWNFNGTGDSSTNNLSPFSGSSLVYNTQYTFDILSSSFWYQPELGNNWTSRWVAQLVRQTSFGYIFDTGTRWSGFGTTLDVPSNKTYYVGIIGQGAMKVKLDGNTILLTSPSETGSFHYNMPNQPIGYYFPAYQQNMYARYGESFSVTFGILPPPLYSSNLYLTSDLKGTCFDFIFQSPGIECAPYYGISPWGKFSSGYNLYIYPVTMSAGCHKINFEVNTYSSDKYCNYNDQGFIGAAIFDMTAEQLVSASNYNDLNIVWDSTYLEPITLSNSGVPKYMYSYDIGTIPSSSFYTSYCPSGSTPIGGDPCNGCQTTQSVNLTIPCGDCIECTHGLLYNGYVVDAGGPANAGRGTAGIVNTDSIDNPVNTWKIPEDNDWYDLITFINNSTPPSNATPTGSYGVDVGGKLKDYTRDLIATCWGFPNVGAQTDDLSSGWNGVAGGIRDNVGVFSELLLEGYWWTANSTLPSAPLKSAAINLKNYSNEIFRDNLFKSYGCSIRLVRPAEPGETSGNTILNAYIGNDGTVYDGIVLGNQVWLTVNLSETEYNNGSNIVLQPNANVWDDTLTTANKFACYYNNSSLNANLPTGNVNPVTGRCYEYPTWYVYRKCGGTDLLIQTEPGATVAPGRVQKADDYSCWEFVEEVQSNTNVTYQLYITGNYFENNPTVYDNCEECTAIHTIYLNFGSKNC